MRQMNLMPLADPKWVEVLRAEASKPKRTKQAIANELGVSRTAISLICDGKYSARMDKVSAKLAPKVMSLYAHTMWCPHLRSDLTPDACRHHASAPMPTSDPDKLRHWAACRNCAQNPVSNDAEVKDAV
ncbi:MarR family transcriptional regulator [Brucella intermedia]|uniref:MarR family transcriptional regulator n=1 Tax=Brucella intermedia TaxID=94625 RepID=UPI00235EA5FA|nr:MarR family transcriptional regulator [Brucella intermedia]